MNPHGRGKHVCPSVVHARSTTSTSGSVRVESAARSWRLESLGHQLTRRTPCWWCGAPVFFHTNGFGDCVLFDELGWPWAVHPCWENHREQSDRRRRLNDFENDLQKAGYDGQTMSPDSLDWILSPEDENRRFILVDGYIDSVGFLSGGLGDADNFSIDGEPNEWMDVSIIDHRNRMYFFMIPISKTEGLSESSVVRAVGRWTLRNSRWLLLTTRVAWCEYPNPEVRILRVTKLGRKLRCRFCRRPLAPEDSWGFNRSLTVECAACSSFRDGRDPRVFEAFCRRLVRKSQKSQAPSEC